MTDNQTQSGGLDNVTSGELVEVLGDLRMPPGVDEEEWSEKIAEAQEYLGDELADLDIPLSQTNPNVRQNVCTRLDRIVDSGLLDDPVIQRIRYEAVIPLALRIKFGTSEVFDRFLEYVREKDGKIDRRELIDDGFGEVEKLISRLCKSHGSRIAEKEHAVLMVSDFLSNQTDVDVVIHGYAFRELKKAASVVGRKNKPRSKKRGKEVFPQHETLEGVRVLRREFERGLNQVFKEGGQLLSKLDSQVDQLRAKCDDVEGNLVPSVRNKIDDLGAELGVEYEKELAEIEESWQALVSAYGEIDLEIPEEFVQKYERKKKALERKFGKPLKKLLKLKENEGKLQKQIGGIEDFEEELLEEIQTLRGYLESLKKSVEVKKTVKTGDGVSKRDVKAGAKPAKPKGDGSSSNRKLSGKGVDKFVVSGMNVECNDPRFYLSLEGIVALVKNGIANEGLVSSRFGASPALVVRVTESSSGYRVEIGSNYNAFLSSFRKGEEGPFNKEIILNTNPDKPINLSFVPLDVVL